MKTTINFTLNGKLRTIATGKSVKALPVRPDGAQFNRSDPATNEGLHGPIL